MGWAVGAGLAMLLLLVLSSFATFLTALRVVTRSERTHFACIAAPAFAACIGFGVVVLLRLVNLPTVAFDIFAIGSVLGVAFGCLIGCVPLQTR